MHRALLLPEIIETILRAELSWPRFLYTCLFINKDFSLEASRILWHGCGSRYNSATARHVHPDIKDLVHIILRDLQRAQFYANFIHILRFDERNENYHFIAEARWHQELAAVQFPQLEEVGFFGFDHAALLNRGDVIIHYAQPNVKRFTLRRGSLISDSFLDTLSRSCPKLKSLSLMGISKSTVTEDGLVRFLENTNSLKSLDIRTGLDNCWSYKALNVITRYRNLELLSIPAIQDGWIDCLCDASHIDPAFPKLDHFYSSISNQGLEFLAQYTPNLKTLCLDLRDLSPSQNILASASNFTRLTRLKLRCGPQSSLGGRELVLLSQKCSELIELSIWNSDEESRPFCFDISDSVIDKVAQNLPKLSELSLVFDRLDLLTWNSLVSLGRHCKDLEMLDISCNFGWQEVVNGAQEIILFPKLWSLGIFFNENNRGWQADGDEVNAIGIRFAALAPKLTNFAIQGGNHTDKLVAVLIDDICVRRSW